MRILLTNDDGYRADGICALANVLKTDHDVTVVAPTKNHSGASHSTTFYRDVAVRKSNRYAWECYHVDGTPVDCVRFGIEVVLKDRKPDLVVSGINDVANVGTDILYSGTVQAAIQAYMLGYRSIAVSTDGQANGQYLKVADYVKKNLFRLYSVAEHGAVNCNYPVSEPFRGTKLTRVGKNLFTDEYIVKRSRNGKIRYRLIGDPVDVPDNPEDCDVNWYKKGYVSVTLIEDSFRENNEKAAKDFDL